MKERTSAHDTIKTTGLKRFAEDCGVYAKVEPSELHPEDNLRRVDLVVSFPEGNVLVDVAVIAPLCKTHIKDTAKESQGALLKKEAAKCRHHHGSSVRHEMEFVPFIADLHGSLGRDAIQLLKRLCAQCPRPRLAGQNPKSRVYEEMAAVAMVILRSVCLVTRLAFARGCPRGRGGLKGEAAGLRWCVFRFVLCIHSTSKVAPANYVCRFSFLLSFERTTYIHTC